MNEGREKSVPERLASIEEKLDLALEARKDHEERLRRLERLEARLIGGAGVISFLGSGVGLLIAKAVFNFK